MSNIISTATCDKCVYGYIDDENKARVKVICNKREKTYYYGQHIPSCEDRQKKLEVKDEESSEV